MERRKFVKLCCLAGVGVAAFLESCKTAYYAPVSYSVNVLTVNKTDVTEKDFFLVRADKLPAPLCLSRNIEGEYTAALMICTHKSCELNTAGTYLHCPCHGSEFTVTGKVLQGPAEEDLKQYPVTTDDDRIYIHI